MTSIVSPLNGTLMTLSEVPDPVFAQGLVGPGVALQPTGDGDVTAVAPVAGRIVKLHPHAFVLQADGFGVLVHLGIDTVQLEGEGFTLHTEEGAEVSVGDELITWNPARIVEGVMGLGRAGDGPPASCRVTDAWLFRAKARRDPIPRIS